MSIEETEEERGLTQDGRDGFQRIIAPFVKESDEEVKDGRVLIWHVHRVSF